MKSAIFGPAELLPTSFCLVFLPSTAKMTKKSWRKSGQESSHFLTPAGLKYLKKQKISFPSSLSMILNRDLLLKLSFNTLGWLKWANRTSIRMLLWVLSPTWRLSELIRNSNKLLSHSLQVSYLVRPKRRTWQRYLRLLTKMVMESFQETRSSTAMLRS